MMTIPGLALFYGGLVRQKNICDHPYAVRVMATGIISIIWVAFGYSWVFGTSFIQLFF